VSADLVNLLRNAGSGYSWSAAAASAMTAGPLELASGTAVMSLGGFNGQDPAVTLDGFKADVAAHKVRYYVAGGGFGGPGGFGPGGDGGGQSIASWVSSTFRARTVGGYPVYDLSTAASSGTTP
jgi:hypothetical protein